jgi:hypothetical protein
MSGPLKLKNFEMGYLNPKYALDFLLRAQNASKSNASLHLTHSP